MVVEYNLQTKGDEKCPPAKTPFYVFVSQGPAPLNGGGVDGITNSPVSGAIEAVAPHPATVGTLLIGGVNGGIWRTVNATAASPTWTSVSDTGSISDIKYDLSDGTSMTLLAGIGRTSSFGNVGSDRNGLLRSTDGGTTWSAITTLAGGPNVRAVEPRGANLVVGINAADSTSCGDGGLFHSADTGATFTQRHAGITFDVTANPLTTGASATEMFASVDNAGAVCSGTVGIHRSGDSGATWAKVSNATMDGEIAGAQNVAISVGRQGSAGTDANVYVAICSAAAAGKLSSLWRSPDSGANFVAMTLPMTAAAVPQATHPGNQCSPHLSLQADPTNHNVVYIGGDRQPDNNEETGIPADPQFPNSHGASNYSGQLHRVDATGTLSNPLTHCLTATPASCTTQSTTLNSAPHADSRDMGFDANGDLIQSDDGGVYRHSNPIGVGDWASIVGNLEVNEAHDAAYDRISKSIISGMQDNSNGDRDGVLPGTATTWTSRDSGDGGDVGVGVGDPSATESTRYSSAQNLGGLARRVYNNTNVLQSTAFPALAPGGDPAMVAQFITPLAVNSITPTRIIFGGSNGVYESADRGDTIAQINMDDMEETLNFVYGTTGNAEFLAYSRDADMAVCIRTLVHPAAPICTIPPGITANPVDIVVDPQDATRLVAVTPSQVFETSNGGAAWTDVTGDLLTTNAAGQLFSAELIRTATRLALLVGTRNGVFFDPNGLAGAFGTYGALSTGLGKAPVYDLQYNAADDRLMVGTLGRGAYTLDNAMGTVPVELISFEIDDN